MATEYQTLTQLSDAGHAFQEQLDAAAVDLEIASKTLDETAAFVRTHAALAADDPHIIFRFGQMLSRVHAAGGLLTRAARLTTAQPAIEAQISARDIADEIRSQLTAWGGVPAQSIRSRVAGPASHWGYHHVGHDYLSGAPLSTPSHAANNNEAPVVPTTTALPSPVHVIASDAEAIAVAQELAARLAPGASARDRERRLPLGELDELSRSGLLAITVPRAFGGAEVSCETLVTVFQILSAADPAIGQLPQNHFVFAEAIRYDGAPAQQEIFFRELLGGARFGNAQAERGGSSALNLGTRLLRGERGGYRLNGTKYYCTGAITSHWIPVAALDDLERQVLAYVPRHAAGVEVLPDWNAMGQRVTYSGTAHFKDVAVPPEHVIQHWQIFERPNLFHSVAQLLHAAIDVGIAQNALDDTAAALRQRKRARLGAAVERALDDPHVLRRFGELTTAFHAAEELTLRAARLVDAAGSVVDAQRAAEVAIAVSEAKAFVEDVVIAITNEMFALLGSSATDADLNLHRHWRNARTHTVHDANQWRYHTVGNYFLNGVAPGKPVRRLADKPLAKPTQ